MTAAEFARGMAVLVSVFNRGPAVDDKARRLRHEAYFSALSHIAGDVWEAAVARCVAEQTFFPVPMELLNAARAVGQDRRGVSAEAEAAAVFETVRGATVHGLEGKAREYRFPHVHTDVCPLDCELTHEKRYRTVCPDCDSDQACKATWCEDAIREALGDAAADAFLAAGGQETFAAIAAEELKARDLLFVRRTFSTAYLEAVRRRATAAVPVARLTAGELARDKSARALTEGQA